MKSFLNILVVYCFVFFGISAVAQSGTISLVDSIRFQTIDGFGAHQSGAMVNQSWWNQLFFEDLEASIYRVDLTPQLVSPYSDLSYFSPWFMGSSTKSVFNLEDPANPNGPEGNRVRTYTGPNDYSRLFGGRNAPIAVMGPDIERNIAYFRYQVNGAIQAGKARKQQLGDFKLIGSIWSPVPWVKVSSGNRYPENWWPGPVILSPWPFIWGGNFAGGRLDVSGTPLNVFNDLSVGGTGPTSSLTQFARSTAAYILGYQRYHDVQFYAISIQNELNFEVYYNSATYPLSSQYIAALKRIRAEFDQHPELRNIRIMGPEDLLGGDSYGMWEYGGPVHKNLQYLKNIAADTAAMSALDFFCIHGYANDGVTASGSNPRQWDWWVNGWTSSPAPGLPVSVKGIASFGKKSWMTETSGEYPDWLFPKTSFPGEGGFGLGIRIQQALTSGMESAWIYWTFADSDDQGQVSLYGLTNQAAGANAPKYVAAKHFFKFIRPGAYRIGTTSSGANGILTSAYIHPSDKRLTAVFLNTNATSRSITVQFPFSSLALDVYLTREQSNWQKSTALVVNGSAVLNLPPYSLCTVTALSPVTGVEDHQSSDDSIFLYPNPFTNELQVIGLS
ncbi:MAG TPA: glycoside hydrolase family 30 beta sandwich domain-containing protein, partial [Saprospiraceae bacterium]|nr:glycoside hydrolase family 30 beta sandwich domain-containing protein [Saprospiraceae bacterium]